MKRMLLLGLVACLGGCDERALDLGGDGSVTGSDEIVLLLDGKQIAMGGNASCFRRADGAVKCWGQNDRGQLSVATEQVCGSLPCTSQPFTAPELDGSLQVALGYRFGCAITDAGGVRCWGENTFGELGRGTHDDDAHREPLDLDLEAETLWLGAHHACVRDSAGRVHCWGLGDDGQLGLPPSELERCGVPAELRGNAGVPVAADAACASEPTPVPAFDGAEQLALGDAHTCARFDDGRVLCLGRGDSGQLGDGTTTAQAFEPVEALASGASDVQAGAHHSCAIVDGRVRCWGGNELGQLGVGSVEQEACTRGACLTRPSQLGDLPKAERLALGATSTCAALGDGSVHCWGDDALGQLGNSSAESETCSSESLGSHDCQRRPLTTAYDLRDVVELRAGASHACALLHDELRCWGSAESGQSAGHDNATFPSLVYGLN